MKKLIFLIVLSLIAIPLSTAHAITTEELEGAEVTIRKVEQKLRMMKICINTARRGKSGLVDITAEQKQGLIDLYSTSKGEAETEWNELP